MPLQNTKIINLYGAPGAGKSTTAPGVFHKLKLLGYNAEYVPEVAKDFTWEERKIALSCQPYVFGKQYRDMYRLLGKVQFIVTDSPIFLSVFYGKKYPNPNIALDTFLPYVVEQAKLLGGINYFLNRVKKYNPMGRNQTEQESDEFSKEILFLLKLHNIDIKVIDGDESALNIILKDILGDEYDSGGISIREGNEGR